MSIVSYYDPEAEKIQKIYEKVNAKLGPLGWFTCKTEADFIQRMKLLALSEEEMCYALDRYRKIQAGQIADEPQKHYPKGIVAVCVIIAIILFILGFCRG